MEKIIQLLESFLALSNEQRLFVIAVLAISVTGFALYVVLAVLKATSSRGGQ